MSARGRLIVLEGVDASGKTTQYELLQKRLREDGIPFRPITFPCYESPGSAPVRMYLGGELGKRPEDVNAFAASALFAVDRLVSYKTDWGEWYESGGLVLAARYTTSNAVHQVAKLPADARTDFLSWLYELEFDRMGLPRPDQVLFLDVPPEVSFRLLRKRCESGAVRDIHEADEAYLSRCYEAAVAAAEHYGWERVRCVREGELRTVEEISDELYRRIRRTIDRKGE